MSATLAAPPAGGTAAWFDEAYTRLKAMASRHRARAGSPASLCTTEIVHEVFLRMGGSGSPRFASELQFFAYAARAMRHVLVDLARQRLNLKAGAGQQRLELDHPAADAVSVDPALALELDAALRALEADSPRAAQVVELHWFAGLPLERVAELVGRSPRTIDREWRYARSFLAVQAGA